MTDTFEKVSYIALEEQPLTLYEWIFGKSEPEIEADPKSKDAKYRVTQQIKTSAGSHIIMKKHQSNYFVTDFDHTQSVVKTDQKMEDRTSELPSPPSERYQIPPTLPVKQIKPQIPKKLHPSIAQLRRKGIKDDLDL
jgi:hypothetical protein